MQHNEETRRECVRHAAFTYTLLTGAQQSGGNIYIYYIYNYIYLMLLCQQPDPSTDYSVVTKYHCTNRSSGPVIYNCLHKNHISHNWQSTMRYLRCKRKHHIHQSVKGAFLAQQSGYIVLICLLVHVSRNPSCAPGPCFWCVHQNVLTGCWRDSQLKGDSLTALPPMTFKATDKFLKAIYHQGLSISQGREVGGFPTLCVPHGGGGALSGWWAYQTLLVKDNWQD